MNTGIFDYTIILSVIHKRELAKKDTLYKFLYYMTNTEVTIKNYEQLLNLCKANLTTQFADLNSDEVNVAFNALDLLHGKEDARKTPFDITSEWLKCNRRLFKCQDKLKVEPLRNISIKKRALSPSKELGSNHEKHIKFVKKLWDTSFTAK